MHRSAGKSPGFISWPCHMTWGQGYQRLPPHMEKISGHQLQQLLVSSPLSILYSAHACALLKTQTRQPWSATATEMMDELHVCPQPVTPAGSRPQAWTPFCTHLLSLEETWDMSSFSQLVETCQCVTSQHHNAFSKLVICCLPSQSLCSDLLAFV